MILRKMEYLLRIMVGIISLTIVLMAYRILRGPTVFDRLTGLGVIGTDTILLLLLVGYLSGRIEMFIDISLAYALIGFVTFLVLAKYFEKRGEVD